MLPLELDATGARTVKFDARLGSGRTVHLEAVADPVMAGFTAAIELFRGEAIELNFLTDKAKMAWRNQAVDAPRLNSSLSISRGVAPPRICRGVSLSSFCTHATCSGVTVAKSVPFL